MYGSQVTASLGTKGEGLPAQQKILVASLLLMAKRGKTKEVTLGKLIDTYGKVLKKRNIEPELESSCVGMIGFEFILFKAKISANDFQIYFPRHD